MAAKPAGDMTLKQVGEVLGISYPTLNRYKTMYGDQIPMVGEGRAARFPQASLEVFRRLKEENMARRGRPPAQGRAAASAALPAGRKAVPARKPAATASASMPAAETSPVADLGSLANVSEVLHQLREDVEWLEEHGIRFRM